MIPAFSCRRCAGRAQGRGRIMQQGSRRHAEGCPARVLGARKVMSYEGRAWWAILAWWNTRLCGSLLLPTQGVRSISLQGRLNETVGSTCSLDGGGLR